MIKLAIMFGGKSTEHDISLISGVSVINNLNKEKYMIFPIYIDRDGNFYKYIGTIDKLDKLVVDDIISNIQLIDNIFSYLQDIDVVFPVLHGLCGEDGTIQGMLELMGKRYVGCKVLSSSLCMDKVYAKVLFKTCGIDVAKSMYIIKLDKKYCYINDSFERIILNESELQKKVLEILKYPVFIKPSNSGSSIGVNKVYREAELIKYLEEAFKYDSKVLIEEVIVGREVECAVLGVNDPVVSYVGEVLAGGEFYSYDSKYKDSNSLTIIPALFSDDVVDKIRDLSLKAYLACDCRGLSRVDFFVEKETDRIIINEINTMPGFTEISMYPKLMKHFGYNYSELLDKLIEFS